jgi:hypothetical protein
MDDTRVIADEHETYVAFSGSVEEEHAVTDATRDRFVDARLELGGKDQAYVR